MSETKPKFIVELTQDFRLAADSDNSASIRNLVLQRKVIVDPTKAPGFQAKLAADPTLSTDVREEYRDDGYYPVNPSGLTSAINSAVIRTVIADCPEDLAEFLRRIKAEIDRIAALVDGAFKPANSEEDAE